jgi:hypothetical protein
MSSQFLADVLSVFKFFHPLLTPGRDITRLLKKEHCTALFF